jgi:uncharacterized protein
MNLIEQNKKVLIDLCKKHKVDSLFIFGSYAKGNEKQDSDVDLLVTFGDIDLYNYFDNYYSFLKSMEELFNKKIDLVSEKYIRNPYLKKSIDDSKVMLYERGNQSMAA